MQQEMIAQIEAAKPEFMVFVNVVFTRPGWSSPIPLNGYFNWFDSYRSQFYDIAGVASILPSGQTVYRWNKQTANYTPASEYWVAVFKRRH